jgi:hypothetical protein
MPGSELTTSQPSSAVRSSASSTGERRYSYASPGSVASPKPQARPISAATVATSAVRIATFSGPLHNAGYVASFSPDFALPTGGAGSSRIRSRPQLPGVERLQDFKLPTGRGGKVQSSRELSPARQNRLGGVSQNTHGVVQAGNMLPVRAELSMPELRLGSRPATPRATRPVSRWRKTRSRSPTPTAHPGVPPWPSCDAPLYI